MENPGRHFHLQAAVSSAGRGAAVGALTGLLVGLAELLYSAAVGEWVLVRSPAAYPVPYMAGGLILGSLLGVLALLCDAGLRRLGRERPRPGILLPLVVGFSSASYGYLVLTAAEVSWTAGQGSAIAAFVAVVAASVLATRPMALHPAAPAWAGLARTTEIVGAAALSLLAASTLALRSGWFEVSGMPPLLSWAAPVLTWIIPVLIYPLGLLAGLWIEGTLLARAQAAGRFFRFLRPVPLAVFGLLLAAAVAASSTGSAAKGPNLLLVVLDGARRDSVSALARTLNPTPGFDRVASAGALFEQARSNSPWCLPANLSILTGAVASAHGVTEQALGEFLPERRALVASKQRVRSLAEILSARGFATAGFSANPWVGNATGLDAGFDRFFVLGSLRHSVLRARDFLANKRADPWVSDDGAETMTTAALSWLEAQKKPFFVFLNLSEAMPPWTPPMDPYLNRALKDVKDIRDQPVKVVAEHPLAYSLGGIKLDWKGLDVLRTVHQAEVAAADAALATLLATLEKKGLLKNTLVAVTSDHGHVIDDSMAGNHPSLSEATLRVPLALSGPGVPAGRRIATPVSTLDIAPTLLALAGLPPEDPNRAGRSLLPLFSEDPTSRADFDARPHVAEYRSPLVHLGAIRALLPGADLRHMDTDQYALFIASRKLRRNTAGLQTTYDLHFDPSEENAGWQKSEEGRIAESHLANTLESWLRKNPLPASSASLPARFASRQVLAQIPFAWR